MSKIDVIENVEDNQQNSVIDNNNIIKNESEIKENNKNIYNNQINLYILSFILGTSGTIFGYNLIVFNGLTKPYLNYVYGINDKLAISAIQGNLTLFFGLGAAIGCLCCGYIINLLGRKKSIILFSLLNFLFSFLFLIKSLPVIYFEKFINGIFVGIYLGVTQGIISELVPKKFRNFGVQTFNVTFLGSLFIVMLLFYLLKNYIAIYWYIFISGNAIIEFFRLIILLIFLKYESPNYLFRKDKIKYRNQLLKYFEFIYIKEEFECEYNKFQIEMDNLININGKINIKDIVYGKNKKGFLLALIMNFAQEATGISVINFFSVKFFSKFSDDPYLWAMLLALTSFIGGFANSLFKRFSKKRVIIIGTITLEILMICIIICNELEKFQILAWFLLSYSFLFSISFEVTFFDYLSHINESEAMVLSSFFFWLSISIFSKLTPIMLDKIDVLGTYLVFIGIITIFNIIFAGYGIEINNKTKSQIKIDLNNKRFFK